MYKKIFKVSLFILTLLFFNSKICSGMEGLDFNLPMSIPPSIPYANITQSPVRDAVHENTPVTITARIITRSFKDHRGNWNPPTATKLKGKPKLYYSTNYAVATAANPPTWNVVDMECDAGTYSDHRHTYNCRGTIPGLPKDTRVHYYISAQDDRSDPTAEIYNNITSYCPTPTAGPGWDKDWKDVVCVRGGDTAVNETKTFSDPQANRPKIDIDSNLDVTDVYVAKGNPGTGDHLFIKIKVRGVIHQGDSGLNGANVYVVAIANMIRPLIPYAKKPDGSIDGKKAGQGLFALVYFPNHGQTGGLLKHIATLIDGEIVAENAEKIKANQLAMSDIFKGTATPVTYSKSTSELQFRIPLKDLVKAPDPTQTYLHEPNAFIILAGGGKITIPGGDLKKTTFVIHDVTNGVLFYTHSLHTYRVKGGTPPTGCGNGICESGETPENCPADCKDEKPVCGNGKCESGETAANCPQDCATQPGEITVTGKIRVFGPPVSPDVIKNGLKFCQAGQAECIHPTDPSKITVTGNREYPFSATLPKATYVAVELKIANYLPTTQKINISSSGALKYDLEVYAPKDGGDLSGDNKVDQQDMAQFIDKFKKYTEGGAGNKTQWEDADYNKDNKVDLQDFVIIIKNFGKNQQR